MIMKKNIKLQKKAANRVAREIKKMGAYDISSIIYRTNNEPYYCVWGYVEGNTTYTVHITSGGCFNSRGRRIGNLDIDNIHRIVNKKHTRRIKHSNYSSVVRMKKEISDYLEKYRGDWYYDSDCMVQYMRELNPHVNARLYKAAMAMMTIGYNMEDNVFCMQGTGRILAELKIRKSLYRKTLNF